VSQFEASAELEGVSEGFVLRREPKKLMVMTTHIKAKRAPEITQSRIVAGSNTYASIKTAIPAPAAGLIKHCRLPSFSALSYRQAVSVATCPARLIVRLTALRFSD
jgi:hypothetical protein